jgi:sarcosine oxidase subunit beta
MADHDAMRVCVIGAGVVGCSVGLELRRRGADVTVVDKNGDVGHGSTSASCGIVRRFYSQPGMVAMAHEASHIWADWSGYLGPIDDHLAVFHRPGMLFIPPQVDDGVRGIVAEMKHVGIEVSLLSTEEVAERFPFLDTTSQFPPRPVDDPEFFETRDEQIRGAVFEHDAGYVVSPGLATQNLRLAGERDGVLFRLNRDVLEIRKLPGGGFRLVLNEGSIETEVVINVAGPHSARVNRIAGVTLPLETRPLRREVQALANPLYKKDEPGVVPIVGDLDGGIYFRPETGGRDLIVGTTDPACDAPEWLDDPDDYERGVTELYRQRHSLRLMKRFPQVTLGPSRGVAALYDVTVRDWYPIADRTELPGYYVCIGTSGSSFKTAPVLGQLMAEIVEASEGGRDIDTDPITLELARTDLAVDASFLSRLRGEISTTGTVIG